jgi:hypothetical protein
LDSQDANWTLDHIRRHIEQGLPLVPLFNIDVIEATPKCGAPSAYGKGSMSLARAAASPARCSSHSPMSPTH